LDETPLEVQLQVTELTGVELGIQGFGGALAETAQVGTATETGLDNTRELEVATIQLDSAIRDATSSSLLLVEAFAAIDPARADIFDVGGGTPAELEKRRELVAGIVQQIDDLNAAVLNIASTKDTTGIESIITQLERFVAVGEDTGGIASTADLTQQAGVAEKLLGALRSIREAEAEFEVQRRGAAETATAEASLQRAADAVTAVTLATQGTTAAANEAAGTFVTRGGEIISIEQQKRQEIEATTRALREQESASAARANPGFASGGQVMHFADGGSSAARGTDTVPAMLSPGEFVVNAGSSRRFFSELVAINAGKPPVFKQEGGEVNNNFTGDINLNVSAPNGMLNGREAANQIRRELRRKTAKL
jgi:hypothetical protein